MAIKYFVDKNLIPDDGSIKLLKMLDTNISSNDTKLYVYPDVHYKSGARVVNGLIIQSENNIYPACLGVENCGFTFGLLGKDLEIERLNKVACDLSKNNFFRNNYSEKNIEEMFSKKLKDDFSKKRELYEFLGYKDHRTVVRDSIRFLRKNGLIKMAAATLCHLGGGNHFLEIHKIAESENDHLLGEYMIIVHSDSISVGNYVNLVFSNLSELDYLPFVFKVKAKTKYRIHQFLYYMRQHLLLKDFGNIVKLCFSQKDYRSIKCDSILGKNLLLAHNIASVFGEMNREELLRHFSEAYGGTVNLLGSHCHDNVTIETYSSQKYVVHRNGVQKVGDDELFILPQAMGIGLILMKNPQNEKALFSANHGTGRFQDKPVAKEIYKEDDTENELAENNVSLFRVGNGNLAEQNHAAFKKIDVIASQMKKFNLGIPIARTIPVIVIKG